MCFLVPKKGHGVTAGVTWVSFLIELSYVCEAVERFGSKRPVTTGKEPAVVSELDIGYNEFNYGLEGLEGAGEDSTMGLVENS